MNFLSWNCRVLGNPQIVQRLCWLVKQKRSSMIFLMETKLRKKKMESIRLQVGFPNMLVMDCVGRNGGLSLLWGNEIEVEIQNYSHHHINSVAKIPSSVITQWKFSGFYGHLDPMKRHEGWALLKYLKQMDLDPWVCFGDFNKILFSSNKLRSEEHTSELQSLV